MHFSVLYIVVDVVDVTAINFTTRLTRRSQDEIDFKAIDVLFGIPQVVLFLKRRRLDFFFQMTSNSFIIVIPNFEDWVSFEGLEIKELRPTFRRMFQVSFQTHTLCRWPKDVIPALSFLINITNILDTRFLHYSYKTYYVKNHATVRNIICPIIL